MVAISRSDTIALVGAVVSATVLVGWIFSGLKSVFTYRLQDSKLYIRIFKVPVRRVPLSDIDSVEVIPFGALLWVPYLNSLKFNGYRKWVVAIKLRKGLVRSIIISPENPEAFASSLRVDSGARVPGLIKRKDPGCLSE